MLAINFLSGNANKAEEIRMLGKREGIEVRWIEYEKLEIQSDDPAAIAKNSALTAFEKYRMPLIVEDTGLFIEALKGFPGAYASYVYSTIGLAGILKMLEGAESRRAYFKTSFCYADGSVVKSFDGKVNGTIATEIRRGLGRSFGYDPIFIPEGQTKTFSEMSVEEKNRYSHRAMAFESFASFFKAMHGAQDRQST